MWQVSDTIDDINESTPDPVSQAVAMQHTTRKNKNTMVGFWREPHGRILAGAVAGGVGVLVAWWAVRLARERAVTAQRIVELQLSAAVAAKEVALCS